MLNHLRSSTCENMERYIYVISQSAKILDHTVSLTEMETTLILFLLLLICSNLRTIILCKVKHESVDVL